MPWPTSCSANSRTALVVESTCQTVVIRLPTAAGWGARVHTIPDALATSIAATRSTICSCSSTWTCWPAGTDVLLTASGRRWAAQGLGWDTETLTGVLMATMRDPAVGPRRQTQARPPTAKDTPASAGSPPHFHACTTSHRGHFDSGEDPRPPWQTAWYLPRSTWTSPPPRSSQRPRGRVVLPIFIRRGWPAPAMGGLSGIEGQALCGPPF